MGISPSGRHPNTPSSMLWCSLSQPPPPPPPPTHTQAINIREAPGGGISLTGVSEAVAHTRDDLLGILEAGGALRTTGSTQMNEASSRSHAIFIITLEQVTNGVVNPYNIYIHL